MALVIEKLKRVISSFSTSRSSVKSNFTSDSLLLRQQRTFQQVESLNVCSKSYTFCLYFIIYRYLHVWIRICVGNTDPKSSWMRVQYGSPTLAERLLFYWNRSWKKPRSQLRDRLCNTARGFTKPKIFESVRSFTPQSEMSNLWQPFWQGSR